MTSSHQISGKVLLVAAGRPQATPAQTVPIRRFKLARVPRFGAPVDGRRPAPKGL